MKLATLTKMVFPIISLKSNIPYKKLRLCDALIFFQIGSFNFVMVGILGT